MAATVVAASAAAIPALAAQHATTQAQNHRTASRDAGRLLSKLQLPPGAKSSSTEPAGDGRKLSGPPTSSATPKLVDRRRWWTDPGSPDQVLRYSKAHPPAGGRLTLSGSTGHCRPGHFPPTDCHTVSQFIGFSFPPVAGVLGLRWLLVEVVRLKDGLTGVRADGQVQWIVPRPPGEKVPAGTTLINVVRKVRGQPPSVSRAVTSRSRIRQVIKLVDRLPALQPGVWSCPAEPSNPAVVTLTFRSAPGAPPLARASAPATSGNSETGCDAMSFSIRGRRQTALVHTRHFLRAVGRLIGVRLTETVGHR